MDSCMFLVNCVRKWVFKKWAVILLFQMVSSVPLHGWVSKTCCGQLPWFSMAWIITALERAWRPVVSKLRPSRQVSWQELQEDHTVKWQSPKWERRKTKTSPITINRSRTLSNAFPRHVFLRGLCFSKHSSWDHFIRSPAGFQNI